MWYVHLWVRGLYRWWHDVAMHNAQHTTRFWAVSAMFSISRRSVSVGVEKDSENTASRQSMNDGCWWEGMAVAMEKGADVECNNGYSGPTGLRSVRGFRGFRSHVFKNLAFAP